jgi:hypothetical protein
VPPELETLVVADPPDAWEAAGFRVDPDGTCRIGTVRVQLVGRDQGKGVRSWSLRGIDDAGAVDGVPTADTARGPAEPATHPNGSALIDHVVLLTPDVDRTVAALVAFGIDLRRQRETDTYGAPMRQAFFRLGEPVLEVIGPQEAAGDGPARFFGLAVTVDDLDATAAVLAGSLGRVKDAVQEGRRIATLRHRDLGLSTAVAFMSR